MEVSALHINNKQNDKYAKHPKASSAPINTLYKQQKDKKMRYLRKGTENSCYKMTWKLQCFSKKLSVSKRAYKRNLDSVNLDPCLNTTDNKLQPFDLNSTKQIRKSINDLKHDSIIRNTNFFRIIYDAIQSNTTTVLKAEIIK